MSPLRCRHILALNDHPEASLVFWLATAGTTGAPLPRELATSLLDWDLVVAFALAENSASVVHRALTAHPETSVPVTVRDRFSRLALVWDFKQQRLQQRVEAALGLLADAQIATLLLKGAALARTVYARPIDRPMADVDLLVAPDRAREAFDLLRGAQWTVDSGAHPTESWDGHHHLPPLCDDGCGLRLEIHDRPLPAGHPFRLDRETMLAHARSIAVGQTIAFVAEPHLHTVHAAVHFAWAHQMESGAMNAVRDLNHLVAAGLLNWSIFVRTARQTGSTSCCYWTLRLAQLLTPIVVPAFVMHELEPQVGSRTRALLERHFLQLALRAPNSCPSVALRHHLWTLALQSESDTSRRRRWTGEPEIHRSTLALAGTLSHARHHVMRVPRWSRYIGALLGSALKVPA